MLKKLLSGLLPLVLVLTLAPYALADNREPVIVNVSAATLSAGWKASTGIPNYSPHQYTTNTSDKATYKVTPDVEGWYEVKVFVINYTSATAIQYSEATISHKGGTTTKVLDHYKVDRYDIAGHVVGDWLTCGIYLFTGDVENEFVECKISTFVTNAGTTLRTYQVMFEPVEDNFSNADEFVRCLKGKSVSGDASTAWVGVDALYYQTASPAKGHVEVDELTGLWAYTNTDGAAGTDNFEITAVNSDDSEATLTVTVNVINEVVVDNEDSAPYYTETGLWYTLSTGPSTLVGANNRYTNMVGSTAAYTPGNWLPAGFYTVYIHRLVNNNSDPAMQWEIYHNGMYEKVFVDDTPAGSGMASGTTWYWKSIGNYYFSGAGTEKVVLTRVTPSDSSIYSRADAIKFEPVDGGFGDTSETVDCLKSVSGNVTTAWGADVSATYSVTVQGNKGLVDVTSSTGLWTYTNTDGSSGTDSFVITAEASPGITATHTVTVNVIDELIVGRDTVGYMEYNENGSPEAWATSGSLLGFFGKPSVYKNPKQPAGSYIYYPSPASSGTYTIYAWKTSGAPVNHIDHAVHRYEIIHNRVTHSIDVPMNFLTTGSWVKIGTYYFPGELCEGVRLIKYGEGEDNADQVYGVRAAEIKFVISDSDFTIGAPVFYSDANSEVTAESFSDAISKGITGFDIKLEYTNLGMGVDNIAVIAAYYGLDGFLKDVSVDDLSAPMQEESGEFECNIAFGEMYEAGDYIKIHLWDSLANMRPIKIQGASYIFK